MADLKGKPYAIHVHHDLKSVDPADGNLDLEVRFEDGSRYAATLFTLNNLRLLFEKNEQTGECRDGLYLWTSDMVIVKELTEVNSSETVADLIAQGEFEEAFSNSHRMPKLRPAGRSVPVNSARCL